MADIKLNDILELIKSSGYFNVCVPDERKGTMVSSCSAYKGHFDGHTWYVFYDNLASPSVVHDPLCKCTKKQ